MKNVSCTIGNFFHLVSKMKLLSFRKWWTKSSLACPLFGATLMIILSKIQHEHVRHLQAIFEELWRWGLRLHNGKCKFFHDCLAYLGHMIIPKSLRMQEAKVDVLQKIPAPIDVPKLHTFLGLAKYYYQFIKNINLIAKSFTRLTSKDQPWISGHEQQQAFETLK